MHLRGKVADLVHGGPAPNQRFHGSGVALPRRDTKRSQVVVVREVQVGCIQLFTGIKQLLDAGTPSGRRQHVRLERHGPCLRKALRHRASVGQ